MKRIKTLFVFLLCWMSVITSAKAEITEDTKISVLFPDAKLAQTIANIITEGDVNAEVTQQMLDAIYGLSIQDCDNWEGISVFGAELESLNVTNCSGDVSELSALTGLNSLHFYDVRTTGTKFDLSAMNQLTEFHSISCVYASNTVLSLPTGLKELHLHTSENLHLTTTELAKASELQSIYIVETPLSGSISQITNLKELTDISLCDNDAFGTLADFGKMTWLKSLSLTRINITGDLSSLSNLSTLEELGIGGIDISGNLSSLAGITSLTSIYLGPKDNTNARSRVNGSLNSLSKLKRLQSLGLEMNRISGELSMLSDLHELQDLSMQYIDVSGTLQDLTHLSNLYTLQIGDGVDFEFNIDEKFKNLSKLSTINLSGAKVSGKFRLVENLPNLWFFHLINSRIVLPPIVFDTDTPIATDIPMFITDIPLLPKFNSQSYSISGNQILWAPPKGVFDNNGGRISYSFCIKSSEEKQFIGIVEQPFTKPRVLVNGTLGSASYNSITGLTHGRKYAISCATFDGGEDVKYRVQADGTVGDRIDVQDSYDAMPVLAGTSIVGLENYESYTVYELKESDFASPIPTPTPTPSLGDIVGGEDDFGNLPPVDVPTLILPDGVVMDASAILKYDEPNANKHNTVVYNVSLVNQNGEEIELPEGCILCFPYPEGLNENSKNKYRIIIHHYADNGKTEVFKSENGDIEFTKQGLCIRVSSFSPFEITWEEYPEVDLPRTGDNSRIALWLTLLTVAGAAILTLKRKSA